MRTLVSQRLQLEPQCVEHAEEMFEVLSDPAIYEFENAPPASLEWLRTRFTRLESRRSAEGNEQWLNWVIRLSSGELIGFVQATVFSCGRAAIAYELGSAHWGKGLASEAVQRMLDELHARYGVHTYSAVLKSANTRSLRLLLRLGFVRADPTQHASIEVEASELLCVRVAHHGA